MDTKILRLMQKILLKGSYIKYPSRISYVTGEELWNEHLNWGEHEVLYGVQVGDKEVKKFIAKVRRLIGVRMEKGKRDRFSLDTGLLYIEVSGLEDDNEKVRLMIEVGNNNKREERD